MQPHTRQTGASKGAGEAEDVKQSEGESNNPGMTNGKAGFATPDASYFRPKKKNAERNCDVERYHRSIGITQSGESQRDAVGDGEGADGLNEHPPVFDDQEQAEEKEEMVRAERDVTNSMNNVATHDGQMALRVRNVDLLLRRMNDGGPRAAVKQFGANENVGDGDLQAGEIDALAS